LNYRQTDDPGKQPRLMSNMNEVYGPGSNAGDESQTGTDRYIVAGEMSMMTHSRNGQDYELHSR
jgi:hypothetical protein